MSSKKFPNAAVVNSTESLVPEKLVTELEAEIIEGRRAFIVLADALAQYRYYTRKYVTSAIDDYDYAAFKSDIEGINQWSDGFFERFSETGFVVDQNGHLAHESQPPSSSLFPDEAETETAFDAMAEKVDHQVLSDPHIIGG